MKTIILVCHYFPPQENVGVRRVLFWANYFSNLGYEVTVVTTKKLDSGDISEFVNIDVTIVEFGILKDSVRLVKDFKGNNNKSDKSAKAKNLGLLSEKLRLFKQKCVNPIFGQLIDNRLPASIMFSLRVMFGIGDASKYLRKFINSNVVVISTAPPWPVHIVGMVISKKIRAKRIVDYRDPFSGNHIFSSKLKAVDCFIDNRICSRADIISTVSPSWAEYYSDFNENTVLLRNGFDNNYANLDKESPVENYLINNTQERPIKISYFGSIEVEARVPCALLKAISGRADLEMHFYGNCPCVEKYLINTLGEVPKNIFLNGFVPYSKSLEKMKDSDINVVSESFGNSPSHRGLIPTKIYEYLSVLKPIIVIAGEFSDMHEVCKNSGLLYYSVTQSDFDYSTILSSEYMKSYKYIPNIDEIISYSRQDVAKKLISIIDDFE